YRLERVAKERGNAPVQMKFLEDRIANLERQFSSMQAAVPSPVPGPGGVPPLGPGGATIGEGMAPPGSPSGLAPGTPIPPGAGNGETALATESVEGQDEYKLALRAMRDQQYDKAVQQFRAFQRKYPSSPMADDAQFLIGESYFAQKDYNRAILALNDVVLNYRRGDKVPAALLRQAQAFVEIGDKTDARLILQKLINEYPNTEQVAAARGMLQTLGR
ncbi:MAG: tol-pal system protein YbgF, partial [Candidatus Binatia bacterium]